ncbi:hypothetical protein N0O92_12750 [Alkalihalobacillus sp. MEB130]|uniref:hypothetical protein n=1 Tax=Alkalihalobacillus sp. MEB130 TaxID=2976704 RepID=UPI0028DFE144|nr:hypothetical protein [Alkalihalobacillus sp. MEB130]MDT8861104.1 hypothetical protein [Alkalihalobacillus sp. MEB130]
MKIADKIDQDKLQEILITIYKKGLETENIGVTEIIEEIKQEFMTATKVTK